MGLKKVLLRLRYYKHFAPTELPAPAPTKTLSNASPNSSTVVKQQDHPFVQFPALGKVLDGGAAVLVKAILMTTRGAAFTEPMRCARNLVFAGLMAGMKRGHRIRTPNNSTPPFKTRLVLIRYRHRQLRVQPRRANNVGKTASRPTGLGWHDSLGFRAFIFDYCLFHSPSSAASDLAPVAQRVRTNLRDTFL